MPACCKTVKRLPSRKASTTSAEAATMKETTTAAPTCLSTDTVCSLPVRPSGGRIDPETAAELLRLIGRLRHPLHCQLGRGYGRFCCSSNSTTRPPRPPTDRRKGTRQRRRYRRFNPPQPRLPGPEGHRRRPGRIGPLPLPPARPAQGVGRVVTQDAATELKSDWAKAIATGPGADADNSAKWSHPRPRPEREYRP